MTEDERDARRTEEEDIFISSVDDDVRFVFGTSQVSFSNKQTSPV